MDKGDTQLTYTTFPNKNYEIPRSPGDPLWSSPATTLVLGEYYAALAADNDRLAAELIRSQDSLAASFKVTQKLKFEKQAQSVHLTTRAEIIADREKKIEELRSDNIELGTSLAEMVADISAHRDVSEGLQQQLEVETKAHKEYRDAYRRQCEKNDALQQRLASVNSASKRYADGYHAKVDELADMTKERDAWKAGEAQHRKNIAQKSLRIRDLTKELARANRERSNALTAAEITTHQRDELWAKVYPAPDWMNSPVPQSLSDANKRQQNNQTITEREANDLAKHADKGGPIKSDGGKSAYYDLPSGAENIQDLISHCEMNFSIGNIFKACYRLGKKKGTSRAYDLNKMLFYVQQELKDVKNVKEALTDGSTTES